MEPPLRGLEVLYVVRVDILIEPCQSSYVRITAVVTLASTHILPILSDGPARLFGTSRTCTSWGSE